MSVINAVPDVTIHATCNAAILNKRINNNSGLKCIRGLKNDSLMSFLRSFINTSTLFFSTVILVIAFYNNKRLIMFKTYENSVV